MRQRASRLVAGTARTPSIRCQGGAIINRFGCRECRPKVRSSGSLAPAQPNSSAAASHIVGDILDYCEAVAVEQSSVLRRREACVIKLFALERERTCGFAMLGPSVEHQDR